MCKMDERYLEILFHHESFIELSNTKPNTQYMDHLIIGWDLSSQIRELGSHSLISVKILIPQLSAEYINSFEI